MTLPRMLERPPWDLQQLCEAYQYRHDRQASALHDAMDNQVSFSRTRLSSISKISICCCGQEEPTVSLYLTDETLQFLRPCFDYDSINRPKARWVGIIFIWISILTSILR